MSNATARPARPAALRRPSRSPARSEQTERSRGLSLALPALVILLLCVGATADYLSGPDIAAGAFYLAAVALAGWKGGRGPAIVTVLAAIFLDLSIDMGHPAPAPANPELMNEILDAGIFIAVGWLSVLVGQQQRLLAEHREQLSLANRQMEQEMNDARDLQELLSGPLPAHPAIDLGVFFRPARILGGDMADLSLSPEGRLAVVVADVSGKGSPAALAAAVLTGLLGEVPARCGSPAAAVGYLNARLADRLPEFLFVTLFYGVLDPETGLLTYASAGHEPALLFRGDSPAEELPPTGMVLGMLPEAEYEERTLPMTPGDLLLVYTDGVTDMRREDGTRLGLAPLKDAASGRLGLSAPDLVEEIAAALAAGAADSPDDVTLAAVRLREPLGERRAAARRSEPDAVGRAR